MPHISVKALPGRTEEQKRALAEKLAQDLVEIFKTDMSGVSVSIVDVADEDWDEEVWDKDIEPQMENMYIKPGYKRGE